MRKPRKCLAAALDEMHFAAAAFEMVPDVGPWRLECYCGEEPVAGELAVAIALASLQAGHTGAGIQL